MSARKKRLKGEKAKRRKGEKPLCLFAALPFCLLTLLPFCLFAAHGSIIKEDVSDWPINISSKEISSWTAEGIRVFNAKKEVKISQGKVQLVADNAICWFQEMQPAELAETLLEVYCEGNVILVQDKHVEKYEQLYLHLTTTMGIVAEAIVPPIKILEEEELTETYLRAKMQRETQRGEEFASKTPLEKGAAIAIPAREEIIDIFADDIESWAEDGLLVVVATGNVRIKRAEETLTASNVILWFDRKEVEEDKPVEQTLREVYAEGNITLRRGSDFVIADKVFENKKEDKGVFINTRFKTTIPQLNTPIYFSSDEIKKTSEKEFTAKNGILTTCGFGHPHFYFKGSKIRLIKNEGNFKVSSSGNTIYGGKIPFLYQPYLAWDVQRGLLPIKGFETGSSSKFGSAIQTDWDLYAIGPGKQWADWSALTLNLDFMQKRGVGTGIDFDYNLPETFGLVRSYYLSDHGDTDRLGREEVPIPQNDRGRFLWRHRQSLPYDSRADLEVAYLSDERFLREFFRDDFKLDKDQETVLYIRRLKDNTGMTFEAERHLNNLDTLVESGREQKTAESLPAIQYHIIGQPLWDGALNFTSQSQFGYFNRVLESSFNEEQNRREVDFNSVSTFRFDTDGMLSMPLHPLFFNINPFVGGRLTVYDNGIDSATQAESGTTPARFIGSFGFDISTNVSRVYGVKNEFFQIDHLKHIITPEIRVVSNPIVTENAEALVQIDEVDALDNSHVLMMGLRNRLQTKRGEPGSMNTVDFVNFDIEMYLFPGKAAIDTEGISGMQIRSDNFIQWDLTAQLSDRLTFESERNEFNLAELGFDVFNSGLRYQHAPEWSYFVGYRFIGDVSSSIILSTDYMLTEKWAVAFYEHFDFNTEKDLTTEELTRGSQNLKTQLIFSRFFHEFRGDFTIELDEIRNDKIARFDLVPLIFTKQPQRQRRLWF